MGQPGKTSVGVESERMNESMKIIENGFVFTCDPQRRAGKYCLLIRDDRIVELSQRPEMLKGLHPTAEVIDASGKVLFPGFVDAHFHGESSILRSLTAAHQMARWPKDTRIQKAMTYLRETASADELGSMYRLAYFCALKSGITTVAEFGLDHLDQSLTASFESMRRADLRGCIGLHNGDQIEHAKKLRHPMISYTIVTPDEDDLTTYNLQTMVRLARELQCPLVVHLGEMKRGVEVLKKNFRKSVVQLLEEYRLFDYAIQLTHLSSVETGDVELLLKNGLIPIVSPRSVFDKEVDLPPLAELVAQGVPIALSTDWGVGDPFATIRSLGSMLKMLDAPVPSPYELLTMHTFNSARVLGLQNEIGSLEAGKKADITFVDVGDVRAQSHLALKDHERILQMLLSELSASNVIDVMINGEFFVREHQILTCAEEDLIRESKSLLRTLVNLVPVESSSQDVNASSSGKRSPLTAEGSEDSFEEGFRIVRQKEDEVLPKAKIFPLQTERFGTSELPKDVRKSFGDDDP